MNDPTVIALLLVLVGEMARKVDALDTSLCRMALGMQSGEIPDSALTASSFIHEPVVHGPAQARIRSETGGGAWCPLGAVSKDNVEYLEIDLGGLKVITLIETQGRFGHGQGQEFTEQYMIEYQRVDNGRWFRYRSRRGHELFQGNANTYMAEMRDIIPPVIGRRVRIVPYSTHPKLVCLRVELYGCTWLDGVVSYDMRQGDRRGTDLDLYDYSYDGSFVSAGNRLVGGLGQLTDGEEGQSNFRLDPSATGRRGYEWVGWKLDSFPTADPVDIDFRFDAVRNFSSLIIHVGNAFSKEVRVFRSMTASVEIDVPITPDDNEDLEESGSPVTVPEVEWRRLSDTLVYTYIRDDIIEFPRRLIINMGHRIGQRVVVKMYFDARWIMISEVQFESEYVSDDALDDLLAPYRRRNQPDLQTDDDDDDVTSRGGKQRNKTWRPTISANSGESPPDGANHDVISSDDQSSAPASTKFGAEIMGSDADIYVMVTSSNLTSADLVADRLGDQYIALIVGTLSALIIGLFIVILVVFLRHRRYTCMPMNYTLPKLTSKTSSSGPAVSKSFITFPLPSATVASSNGTNAPTKESSEKSSFDVGTLYANLMPPSPLPTTTVANGSSANVTGGSGAPEVIGPTVAGVNMAYVARRLPSPPTRGGFSLGVSTCGQSQTQTLLASARNKRAQETDMGGWRDDKTALSPSVATAEGEKLCLERLRFLEKLGEWQFGEVHLAAVSTGRSQRSSTMTAGGTSRRRSKSRLVVVRSLHDDVDENNSNDFLSEARSLSAIDDVTVAKVLAVVDHPPTVVLEFGEHGDLKTFLRQLAGPPSSSTNALDGELINSRTMPGGISYGRLLHMTSQIASAMNCFECSGLVHGDLAARNCLVTLQCTVKVCDLGRNQPRHSSDYCRWSPFAGLPVRWMASETLLHSSYSTSSDVWSFAITVWEILTLGRHLPYADLTDEQVVGIVTRRGSSARPPRPPLCTPEIYDLMAECWNADESHRPTFREIDMFLRRKNMGYRPELDSVSLPE